MKRLYTGSGDDGYTGVLGKGRVPKYDPRIEAVGAIDEASSALGLGRALGKSSLTNPLLIEIQRDLYLLMAEVAALPEQAMQFRTIGPDKVTWLEERTNELSSQIELPEEFIIPGDSPGAAALSIARTIVRRAERQVARLFHDSQIENPDLIRYLNRLSSLCFILELIETKDSGKTTPTLSKE